MPQNNQDPDQSLIFIGPVILNNKVLNQQESTMLKSMLESINPNASKLPFEQQVASVVGVGMNAKNNSQSESIVQNLI